MIKTSQSQLQAAFWKVHRHHDNRYYLNIHKILNTTLFIDELPRKCKYCKSYPSRLIKTDNVNERQCQLCGSMNQYPLTLNNVYYAPVDHGWYTDHSYIFPLEQKQALRSLTILCIDSLLDQDSLQMLFEGLKVCFSQQSTQFYSVVITVGNTLGVLNLENEDQPQITCISAEVSAKEIIEQNKITLRSRHIDLIKLAVQEIKSHCKSIDGHPCFLSVIDSYNNFELNSYTIAIVISSKPHYFMHQGGSSLYLIGLFMPDKTFSFSRFLYLRYGFHELYLLSEEEMLNKLYYKVYEILASTSEHAIHRKAPILRTSQQYSGTIQTNLHGLISNRSPFLEVTTANDKPHFIQLQFEYFHPTTKQWFMLVANLQDRAPFRSQALQRCVLANKALQYILNRSFQKVKTHKVKCEFDYAQIRQGLEEYRQKVECATSYMQALVHHLQDYFKEHQKLPYKMLAPFEYISTIALFPVFWPLLLKNRIIYYLHGYHIIKTSLEEENDLEELQRANQLLQRCFTAQDKKFGLFYRNCLDNKTVTVLQKQIDCLQ